MEPTRTYPCLHTDIAPNDGLGCQLKTAQPPRKKPFGVHDLGKIFLDLATTLGFGGDAPSGTKAVRAELDLYGPVVSDLTITRIIQTRAAARATTPLPRVRYPSTLTPVSSSRIVRTRSRNPLPRRITGFIPCPPSSTTGTTAPVSLWRRCCVLATQDRTLLMITARWSGSSPISCPVAILLRVRGA